MLDSVIRAALRYRVLIVLASLAVLGYGTFLSLSMPIDVFPDLDRPRVVLLIECPGLAPEEVESLVAQPIETAILGANGVQDVRSQSSAGLLVVFIEFDWSVEIRIARQIVQERLATITGSLPEGIRPEMTPTSSIMGQILHMGLSAPGGKTTPMELNTLAHWVIRPRLLKIPGMAEVIILGGERKQYQVLIDAHALERFGVSYQDVETALKASNHNVSGGFSFQGDLERPIRILARLGPDPAKVLADLEQIVVKSDPKRSVLLGQVARVVTGPELKRGDASVNGVPGVVITVVKQPHADTRGLTQQVHAALAELAPSLPSDVVIDRELFALNGFIDRGVFNVGEALVLGAVLVLIVLSLFLMNFRTTFITLTAIPLSLALTVIIFKLIGRLTGTELSINVMTLGGIAVAMGELVDDAIVDVENIFRRLRENSALLHPKSSLQVVYEASREVRGAIVFGTIVVILVFLPLFALSGVEGRLFAPLGLAYIVSILASLAVSLTVTPVLSYYLLAGSRAVHHAEDGLLLRLLKWLARPVIRLSMAIPGVMLTLTFLLVLIAGWQMSQLGADFLPPFDEGSVQVNVTMPPGSSLEASNHASRILDAHLRTLLKTEANPAGLLRHFVRRTGRAPRDEHAEPVSATEYILSINPESDLNREETIRRLLADLREQLPGVDMEAEQPLAHLISHMLSGVYAQVGIKVFGEDLDRLRQIAGQIKAALADLPGLSPPVIEAQQQTPEIHIRLRGEDLAHHGLTRGDVTTFLGSALQGEVLSQVLEGQRRFDLLIRLDESYREDYASLGKLRIKLPGGRGSVLLEQIADLGEGLGPNAINRENVRRRIILRCNAQGRDLASVVEDIRERVKSRVTFPPGYYVEYGGQFESQQRATRLIGVLALISVLGMFGVLLVLFPSWRIVLQILNALPTAFIGGVLALVLTGQTLTVASLVGFISLGGIAVRNGILLVSHYVHLMREEREAFSPEMVLRGSLERLSPVLMTALTAGIALVPLVLGGNQPGREILYPVATVILGGLVTSTFCEFLIHPGMFWRFSGKDAQRLAHAEGADDEFTA